MRNKNITDIKYFPLRSLVLLFFYQWTQTAEEKESFKLKRMTFTEKLHSQEATKYIHRNQNFHSNLRN